MLFYASGAIDDAETLALVVQRRIALLTSYAYKGVLRKQLPLLATLLRGAGFRLPYMLDSGAFTAWTKGKIINRDTLIDFYNRIYDEYSDALDLTCVSLDRIPGTQGAVRTADDFAQAARESVDNFEYMRTRVRAYLKPVYHDGDPEYVLRAYDCAPYVSLSANQDMPYSYREAWSLEIAKKLGGKHKLHGLAMTGTRILRSVRWHSVDSAAWRLWAAMGAIAWLREDGSLKILAASRESPRRKTFNGHLFSQPDAVRDAILAQLAAIGITETQVQEDSLARSRWNILVFNAACDYASRASLLTPRNLARVVDDDLFS